MTLTLQCVFLVVSILTFVFAVYKVRKAQLQIVDAVSWLIGAGLLIVLSLFPHIVMWTAEQLGFYSASNFILTMFIFFLLVIVFMQNIKLSMLNEKVKNLNHDIALREAKRVDKNKKISDV